MRSVRGSPAPHDISLTSVKTFKMSRKIRGSGFKHTLPAVISVAGIWVVVLVLTAPVLVVSMMASGIVPPWLHREVWFFLLTRLPLIALAGIGLAIFTTARVAGPMVQLQRAFNDVEGGDMDRRLEFRRTDKHLRELEGAFNGMMVTLNGRDEARSGLEAADEEATRPL